MKIAGLVIGILLMILAGVGMIITLLLPALTHNRVKFSESLIFFIPALLVLFVGFLITIITAILFLRARKPAAQI